MVDVSWTIVTGQAENTNSGDIVVDRIEGGVPTYRRGSTIDLTVGFFGSGASPTGASTRYDELKKYEEYAGSATTFTALDGKAYYKENAASGNEHLVSLDPTGTDVSSEYDGAWAVLVGVEDETDGTRTALRLTISLFILADLGDYADRTSIQNDLER